MAFPNISEAVRQFQVSIQVFNLQANLTAKTRDFGNGMRTRKVLSKF